jgi:A/G-specific adenine glycosylase
VRRGDVRPPPGAPAPTGAFRRALLSWYDANRRDLPWRRERDPYRIWVAEVMLQQTRVEVAARAYDRFVGAFPSTERLARSREERVLSFWSGLGYYSRARALHRAARLLHREGREFPRQIEEARKLPGVGDYTAAAVLSIAYGLPHAAVDGNVNRVLARLAGPALAEPRGRSERALAGHLLDQRRPGDWNQALMELGQTLCLPLAPRCAACPVRRFCRAHRSNGTDEFPPRRERRPAERVTAHLAIVRDRGGRLLLERGAFPFLRHLWLPPIRVEAAPSTALPLPASARRLGAFRHAILHRRFEVNAYDAVLRAADLRRLCEQDRPEAVERRLFDATGLGRIGRSSLLTKALRLLAAASRPVV